MTEQITYKLNQFSDISKAESMQEQLEKYLNAGHGIIIDASDVERIDTAVLQMLLSLSRTLKNQHHQAPIVNPSEAFLATAKLMGMANHLKIVT